MKKLTTLLAAFSIMKKTFNAFAFLLLFSGFSITSLNAQSPFTESNTKTNEKNDSIKRYSLKDTIPLQDINFSFMLGLSDGTDYSQNINSAFESNNRSLSGFTGWLNLEVGLEFKIIDMFYVSTSLEGRFSRIAVTDVFTNATSVRYINALYSVGFGGTYYFPVGKSLLYVNSEILGNFAGSDSDLERIYDFGYEPDGAGFQISAGWRIASGKTKSVGIELGYSILPVSLIPQNSYQQFYPDTKSESKNFGGIFFNVCGNLGLGDY